jgi:hypothetical protein
MNGAQPQGYFFFMTRNSLLAGNYQGFPANSLAFGVRSRNKALDPSTAYGRNSLTRRAGNPQGLTRELLSADQRIPNPRSGIDRIEPDAMGPCNTDQSKLALRGMRRSPNSTTLKADT